MIQYTTTRQTNTSVAAVHNATTDGPEEWGQRCGRKHYSLEIVQHPSRARMCGFGDKDRRPLAPAAVAKMVVRNEDNTVVDVDDIDISFFLVTVDLWSADGKQEMNLVLHPSSADRYNPPPTTTPAKQRKKDKSGSENHGSPPNSNIRPPGPNTPSARNTPTPGGKNSSTNSNNAPSSSTPSSSYTQSQGFPFPPPSDLTFSQYGSNGSNPSSSTPFGPPALPSIQNINREGWNVETNSTSENFRPWSSEGQPWSSSSNPVYNNTFNVNQQQQQSSPPQTQTSFFHSYQSGQSSSNAPTTSVISSVMNSSSSMPSLPRHTYTRTLVGPLSANAQRLCDEHRKPGIFFLFQDLSVRTEGTFRLRLRLMNVGAPPAPEPGAQKVHTDVSPVLAQIFTQAFTVYSAKRFPGVPDTTALSIAFGNQGQKLPLRNRHGPGGKRKRDSDDEDDSD